MFLSLLISFYIYTFLITIFKVYIFYLPCEIFLLLYFAKLKPLRDLLNIRRLSYSREITFFISLANENYDSYFFLNSIKLFT